MKKVIIAIILFCGFQVLEAADAKATAEALLGLDNLRPGLCVYIGSRDAAVPVELAAAGQYHVHCLSSDRSAVEKMREYVDSKGVYGKVVADYCSLEYMPYPTNLINVLIVEDFAVLKSKGVTIKELMRVVAPYSSVFLGNAPADTKDNITKTGYEDAVVNKKGIWTQIIKPWPDGMGEWQQHNHDAGNSRVSRDTLVQPPKSVQWVAGDLWRHEAGPHSIITANGRLFSASSREGIVARDAFNGLKLWQRKPVWFGSGAPGCWIVDNDRLLTVLKGGGPLVALDAATGKTRRIYDFNPGRIGYHNSILIGIHSDGTVQGVEVGSGKNLWKKRVKGLSGRATDSLNMKSPVPVSTGRIILGEDKAFLTLPKPREFVCLELKTGKELWRIAVKGEALAFYKNGILFSAGKIPGKEREFAAFNAAYSPEDGTQLWRYDYTHIGHGGHPFNIFYLQDLVWIHTTVPDPKAKYGKAGVWHGLNPKTGKVERTVDYKRTKQRCFADRATEQYIMSGGMDFLDVINEKHITFKGGRGNCTTGFTPANSLIYQHPNVCVCSSQVRGFTAFGSDTPGTIQEEKKETEMLRLTGSGKPADETPSPEDWPMFRHNPGRSGSTGTVLPVQLGQIWNEKTGGRLSSPVAACGKIYVSKIDEDRVLALDQKTGKTVWGYRANGRVDSPPTVYKGKALFGCSDGWVYCVSSKTGELIWSLQAAPHQRWIVSKGQVESAWPVHGSVLVDNDTVYFAAGRHTEVDGGITVFAVSLVTGETVWKQQRYLAGASMYGGGSTSNRILVSDGKTIAMDNAKFDSKTGTPKGGWRGSTQGVADFFWGGPVGFLTDISRPAAGWHELHHRNWALSSVGTYLHHTKGLILTFSGDKVYGIRIAGKNAWKEKIPGFELFSNSKREGKKLPFWNTGVPKGVLPKAVLSAGDKLFVAAVNPDDGESKGTIFIHDSKDGKNLGTVPLNIKPKFDGMAAVKDNLIVVGQDGEVVCLGKK